MEDHTTISQQIQVAAVSQAIGSLLELHNDIIDLVKKIEKQFNYPIIGKYFVKSNIDQLKQRLEFLRNLSKVQFGILRRTYSVDERLNVLENDNTEFINRCQTTLDEYHTKLRK